MQQALLTVSFRRIFYRALMHLPAMLASQKAQEAPYTLRYGITGRVSPALLKLLNLELVWSGLLLQTDPPAPRRSHLPTMYGLPSRHCARRISPFFQPQLYEPLCFRPSADQSLMPNGKPPHYDRVCGACMMVSSFGVPRHEQQVASVM